MSLHNIINDGYDAFFEVLFADMEGVETFKKELTSLHPKAMKEFDILEELKHEAFIPDTMLKTPQALL